MLSAQWQKSTLSGPNTDACVEARYVDGTIEVRDSKAPDAAPLTFNRNEWDAFVGGVGGGEFNLPSA